MGCHRDATDEGVRSYPHKPVKVVVPFSVGGGSDQFVRIVQKVMRENELFAEPLVVINVPGAGGAMRSRRVMEACPDGYTILNLHKGIIPAEYSGITPYGPEAFTPIAATGRTGMVVCVLEGSPYEGLGALTEAAVKNPESVLFGANVGAPSYIAGRRIEAEVEKVVLFFAMCKQEEERSDSAISREGTSVRVHFRLRSIFNFGEAGYGHSQRS